MPRKRMMDYLMMRDGRNPYGSRGGYITSRDPRDRRMEDYNRSPEHYQRNEVDYEQNKHYQPIEVMGRFNGYYGESEDYAHNGREQNYNYGRDYNYNNDYARGRGRDYGYMPYYPNYMMDYAGDYGEKLTKEELEQWKHKLLQEVEEKDRPFFTKEQIGQKARQMGVQMKDYNEDELVVATAMVYTDYCKTAKKYIGNNMDFYIELARDWLEDKDSSIKGGEKLAIYYDCIIMGY